MTGTKNVHDYQIGDIFTHPEFLNAQLELIRKGRWLFVFQSLLTGEKITLNLSDVDRMTKVKSAD